MNQATRPEKYDPQYAAAALKGASAGASFATLRGLGCDEILHGIHRAAVAYTKHLRLANIDQTRFLVRAFKAAAHQSYNESSTLAA